MTKDGPAVSNGLPRYPGLLKYRMRQVFPTVVLLLATTLAGCAAGVGGRGSRAGHDRYSFWPPTPDEPRVQFLRSFGFSTDVEPPRSGFDTIIFGAEQEVLPIGKPYGVNMWNGRIYVCDITNPSVVILDLVKKQTRLMRARGIEQMVQPIDIAIAPDGMKYVVDRRLGRIFVFSAEDRHVSTLGHRGFIPVGIAVHGRELFVPDFETQSILVLDRFSGETLRSIGGPGGDAGQFVRPLGVAVDATGNIFVTDVLRGHLQKFSPSGEVIFGLGEIADSPGNFVRPKYLAVAEDGVIYVVDAAFQNVQMFNEQGDLLMFFGGAGPFAGSMSLPAGISVYEDGVDLFADYIHPAFDATKLVLVTNQFGLGKVAVYAIGRLKEGATLADIAPYAADVDVSGEGVPPQQQPDAPAENSGEDQG